MKMSQSVSKIVPALLAAQRSMGGATKGAKNPFFKSNYADYGAVLEACKDALNENGIVILQPHVSENGKNFVETVLAHESGEFLSSTTEIVCAKQNDPQALGSAITYARRYGLQSIVSLPTEDDDGEKAMARAPKATQNFAPRAQEIVNNGPSYPSAKVVESAMKEAASGIVPAGPVANSMPIKKSSFKAAVKPAEVKQEEPKQVVAVSPAVAKAGW